MVTLRKLTTTLIFTLCFCLALISSANADTNSVPAPTPYTVTMTADSGTGSLRAAIASANGTTADDTINFNIPSSDTGCVSGVCTIKLTSGVLTINATSTAGKLTITNAAGTSQVAISGNNVSGVFSVSSGANLSLNSVTVTGGNSGNGGGIYNNGTATVTNSTISSNFSTNDGGGIYNNSALTVINSTISNNTAGGGSNFSQGGGIYNNGPLTVTNSTFGGNYAGNGGGINNYVDRGGKADSPNVINDGTVSILNTIISNNFGYYNGPDVYGPFNSQGYNLISNTNGASIGGTTTGNKLNQSAKLAPLANNGGLTQTQALLGGSPAINAGTATGAPTTDQRGAARVGITDIGAFELNNSANTGNYRAALPTGRQTVTYSTTLASYDDVKFPNFTYSVTSGTLPPGLTLTKTASFIAATQTVALTGTPTQNGTYNFTVTSSDGTNTNATDYSLLIQNPTAADVTVSGRVLTTTGRGLTNATVLLTDSDNVTRYAQTNLSGRFNFVGVPAGATYILSVNSKRYEFKRQAIQLNSDRSDIIISAIR